MTNTTTLPGTRTWSVYRDDPVNHVRTIKTPQGSTYYECSVCRCRIWTSSDEALEDFLVEHTKCIGE